jgi:hypothetical protein
MSTSSPTATREPARRARFLRPIRLSTFLLLTVVAGLLIALYAQRIREARLRDAISVYRHPQTEWLLDALDQTIALTYADGEHLDVVLKDIKMRTTKNPKLPKLPTGIPIYIDPIGLQEAEQSLHATVKRPPSADTLTLGEHLRRILEPLGLAYLVKDGFLMVTAKDSLDAPVDEDVDPYLQYRDVLRLRTAGADPSTLAT